MHFDFVETYYNTYYLYFYVNIYLENIYLSLGMLYHSSIILNNFIILFPLLRMLLIILFIIVPLGLCPVDDRYQADELYVIR